MFLTFSNVFVVFILLFYIAFVGYLMVMLLCCVCGLPAEHRSTTEHRGAPEHRRSTAGALYWSTAGALAPKHWRTRAPRSTAEHWEIEILGVLYNVSTVGSLRVDVSHDKRQKLFDQVKQIQDQLPSGEVSVNNVE